uniref:RNase H type-1 domain-containing protein n=1 Tax=Strigamia maritima TaxID=126957 RepID=T1IM77_STRMM
MEAEYIALSHAVREAYWIGCMFENCTLFSKVNTPIVHSDSLSSIQFATNDVENTKTKNIRIRYHFLRDWFEREYFKLMKVPEKWNAADIFTKWLSGEQIKLLCSSVFGRLTRSPSSVCTGYKQVIPKVIHVGNCMILLVSRVSVINLDVHKHIIPSDIISNKQLQQPRPFQSNYFHSMRSIKCQEQNQLSENSQIKVRDQVTDAEQDRVFGGILRAIFRASFSECGNCVNFWPQPGH